MKTLMLGLSAAALALAAPPAQAAATIKVAVDTIFANTANELVSAFQYYYPTSGYSVVVTTADSATLEADIIAGASYDLFLAGSKQQPLDLAANHSSLVVGSTFKYAVDFLALFSTSVDISHGLPYYISTDMIMPHPVADPYGKLAALNLIASNPWRITNFPGPHVALAPDASTSYAALDTGTYAYGFVANSSICSLDGAGNPSYASGTYHHVYDREIDLRVHLTGIKLASTTRTADQEAELANFIAFLTGTADLNSSTFTAGTDQIKGHCFKIPTTP
jgi:molybdate transport system substrate-binding protein